MLIYKVFFFLISWHTRYTLLSLFDYYIVSGKQLTQTKLYIVSM